MARRNTHRRTSTNDPRLLHEIMSMPNRDSLPQKGPEEVPVTFEGVDAGTPVDRRSPERKAWDKRMEALQRRIKARDDKDRKARESAEKAYVESRAAGRPMDENGNPVEDTVAQETTAEQKTEQAAPAKPVDPLANGTRQVHPTTGQQAGNGPLKSRNAAPPSRSGTTGTGYIGRDPNASMYTVDGEPVENTDSATLYNVKDEAREKSQTDAIRARREREREQTDAKSDPRRNYQKYANDQFELDKSMADLRERKRAYREEQEQRRRDRRYQNRDLSNVDDWNNLGREGSNRRNYYSEVQGETAEQKAERTAAAEARDKQIKALQDRFAQMSDKTLLKKGETYKWENGKAVVTDANGNAVSADELAQRKDSGVGPSEYSYGNKFYANDPNRQKELAALGKLVNAAANGKTISDAQIEAATKKLDSWQAEADERGARVQSYQNMRDAEQASNLRRQYGLTDKQAFSDQAVLDYHKSQQKAARTEILKGMQVAPGLGPAADKEGKSAMTKFSGQWQQLLDAGFDPQDMFSKSMKNADNKKAYMEGLASISGSDPDAADKRDQLRRRFIMQQAMEEHGITKYGGENGTPGSLITPASTDENGVERIETTPTGADMARNLPGRKVLFNSRGEAEANQARMESLGGPQSMSPGDVQGALKPKRAGGPDGVTIMRGGSYKDMLAKAGEINQQIDASAAASRGAAAQDALSDANNPNKAEYDRLVAQNNPPPEKKPFPIPFTKKPSAQPAPAQAAAPVQQTAAPPLPETPVVPKKKKTVEAQAAARGGVSALRPRRRY